MPLEQIVNEDQIIKFRDEGEGFSLAQFNTRAESLNYVRKSTEATSVRSLVIKKYLIIITKCIDTFIDYCHGHHFTFGPAASSKANN